jgi:GH35 family endo-1,4-beta-xylanase
MRPSVPALAVLACLPLSTLWAAPSCDLARRACVAATSAAAVACRSECRRRPRDGCAESCAAERDAARAACRDAPAPCAAVCGHGDAAACVAAVGACRRTARAADRACRRACEAGPPATRPGCRERCRRTLADAERGCGCVAVRAVAGPASFPELATGRPADLSLLEPAERALLAEADARAAGLRTRPVRLRLGAPGARVRVVQTKHAFPFGVPIDLRRFANAGDREWFTRTMAAHFGLAVLENTVKWNVVEPAEGVRVHGAADADVAWAEGIGLPVKGHPLLWGIVPPFSSSGAPAWALARFAALPLPPSEQAALREIVRRHVLDLVGRYRGRIGTWDATNETLQPFAQWFVERLGPGIVDDVFRWAHEADPDARLVFNEWIVEVFTGLPAPTAADVRDRVLALRAAGVPVHAVGQQAHFVPAFAFAGIPVDLSGRTRLDAYALALDTLAEAGLPVHVTETNVIAPDDPERRAAQAEGLLRLWWGHPAVEQVVFWGPWNAVAGRDEFDVGLWKDDRTLSRHGEAVVSLLNDRWRTRVEAIADATGTVVLTATLGEHVAEWSVGDEVLHARFDVVRGAGPAAVAVAPR